MPVPTAAIGCALVKISASGPMPTSRYWLQAPCSISTCFRCAASADPGFNFARSSPTSRLTTVRISAAALRSPRARSSITRSIIDRTNVTPAALIACRSIGASSQGLPRSRPSVGVLASTSSSLPIRSPVAARRRSAGASVSHRSRMVGKRGRYVDQVTVAHGNDRGAADIRSPDPPRQRGLRAVVGQHRLQRVTKCGHRVSSPSRTWHPILRTTKTLEAGP